MKRHIELIKNSEATKLFEALGYKLFILDTDAENNAIYFSYIIENKEYSDHTGDFNFKEGQIYFQLYINDINSTYISIDKWEETGYDLKCLGGLDILPLLYPITKLLQELGIDIEKLYNNTDKDAYKDELF